MDKILSSIFIVSMLVIVLPSKAWSCFRGMAAAPVARCQANDADVEYVRAYGRYFKVPAAFIPFDPRKKNESRIKQGRVRLHVSLSTMTPTCTYIQESGNAELNTNLYSLYHYPPSFHSGSISMCYHYPVKGQYISDFIQSNAIITLNGYKRGHEGVAIERVLEGMENYHNFLKKQLGKMNNRVQVNELKDIEHYDAYDSEIKPSSHSMKFIESLAHRAKSENAIFWTDYKRLSFFAKESAPIYPLELECLYKEDAEERLDVDDTLSRYELCELSFLNEAEDVFVILNLHGVNIPFDGKTLDVAPLVKKVREFLEGFAVSENDAGIQELLRATPQEPSLK